MKRASVIGILILSFCGLVDSIYITQHEVSGTPLLCNIQNFNGCNIVAASPYAHLFGIPIAEFGVLFYSIIFVLAALEIVIFDQLLRRVLQIASLVGVLASFYFIFVQVFLIRALCTYCLASAFITILILFLASLIEPIKKRTHPSSTAVPLSSSPPSRFPMSPTT